MATIRHGTLTGYTHHKCRCISCTRAMSRYHREHTPPMLSDRIAMRDLLLELFPDGITPDCPAQRNAHPALPRT